MEMGTVKETQELSKTSHTVFSDFDDAAQDWGWMCDQGGGSAVQSSKEMYEEAKAALERRLLYLEK
jgi:hypothetical protein